MVTLEDLKTRAEELGFNYSYGLFKDEVDPPHIVVMNDGSDNTFADNLTYVKKSTLNLFYTSDNKNIEEQRKIEDILLADISWNKESETYLRDENVFQVVYSFTIFNE